MAEAMARHARRQLLEMNRINGPRVRSLAAKRGKTAIHPVEERREMSRSSVFRRSTST